MPYSYCVNLALEPVDVPPVVVTCQPEVVDVPNGCTP